MPVLAMRQSSSFQSWFNTLKCLIGNLYLSLPSIFSRVGLLGGIGLLCGFCVLNIYTMLQLIWVAEMYPNMRSYSELGEKIWGKSGKLLVDIPILFL